MVARAWTLPSSPAKVKRKQVLRSVEQDRVLMASVAMLDRVLEELD